MAKTSCLIYCLKLFCTPLLLHTFNPVSHLPQDKPHTVKSHTVKPHGYATHSVEPSQCFTSNSQSTHFRPFCVLSKQHTTALRRKGGSIPFPFHHFPVMLSPTNYNHNLYCTNSSLSHLSLGYFFHSPLIAFRLHHPPSLSYCFTSFHCTVPLVGSFYHGGFHTPACHGCSATYHQ